MSGWQTRANCSRSELVRVPFGLSLEMSESWMSLEKGRRHSIGGVVELDGIQVPPIPRPDASTVPRKVGAESTISAHWVGQLASSLASHRKSSSWSRTAVER
jgi:hypothetical protein